MRAPPRVPNIALLDDAGLIAGFETLKQAGKLHFALFGDAEPQVLNNDEKLAVWKKRFGSQDPMAVYAAFAPYLRMDSKTKLAMYLSDEGAEEVEMPDSTMAPAPAIVTLCYRHGTVETQIALSMFKPLTEADEIELADFHVIEKKKNAPSVTGQGIGSRRLFALTETFRAHYPQLTTLKVSAASQGTYTWARLGFVPSQESWEHIQTLLRIKLNQLERYSEPSEKLAGAMDMMRLMIASKDPKSIRLFMDVPITDPDTGIETTVGKSILKNAEWSGSLALDDPKSMQYLLEKVEQLDVKQAVQKQRG